MENGKQKQEGKQLEVGSMVVPNCLATVPDHWLSEIRIALQSRVGWLESLKRLPRSMTVRDVRGSIRTLETVIEAIGREHTRRDRLAAARGVELGDRVTVDGSAGEAGGR